MTIQIIELLTGEKLVGTVVIRDPQFLEVRDVFVLVTRSQDKQTGNYEIGLAAWPMFKKPNDKEFTINSSAIVTSYDATDQISQSYMSAKSSLILPPTHLAATPQQVGLLNEGV